MRDAAQKRFTDSFPQLPFTSAYAMGDSSDQLRILNDLILPELHQNAPLKRIHATHSTVPWLKDLDIVQPNSL